MFLRLPHQVIFSFNWSFPASCRWFEITRWVNLLVTLRGFFVFHHHLTVLAFSSLSDGFPSLFSATSKTSHFSNAKVIAHTYILQRRILQLEFLTAIGIIQRQFSSNKNNVHECCLPGTNVYKWKTTKQSLLTLVDGATKCHLCQMFVLHSALLLHLILNSARQNCTLNKSIHPSVWWTAAFNRIFLDYCNDIWQVKTKRFSKMGRYTDNKRKSAPTKSWFF